MTDSCQCQCHCGPFKPCDVDGGCGHLHREEHRCRRAERCFDVQTIEGVGKKKRAGALINVQNGLCMACTAQVTRAIEELPEDYTDLMVHVGRGDTAGGEKVAGSRDLPVPISVGVHDLAAAIVTEAATWAELVAERLNVDWDSDAMDHHARPGFVLNRATRILTTSVSVLLALQPTDVPEWADNGWYYNFGTRDGIDGATTMLELHQRARAALGKTKLTHRLPAPCPSCDHLTLVRQNGADHVDCQHCHRTWTEQDYQRLTIVLANDYQESA